MQPTPSARPAAAGAPPKHLLIVSGNGSLPRLVAEGARAAGVGRVSVLGIRGSTALGTYRAADSCARVTFGDMDGFRAKIRSSGADMAVLAGGVNPFMLFNPRAAAFVFRELAKDGVKRTNSHTIFTRLVGMIEECGPRVAPATLFLRGQIPAPGVLTRRQPTEREAADLEYAERIAAAVADLDVGQTAVVKDGAALAVEGLDGTDAAFARGGKIARGGAAAVKIAKASHDMRFDIPALGLVTIAKMRRHGISAFGIHAGRAIILDTAAVVAAADKAGIAIVALPTALPPAPMLGGADTEP